MSSMPSGRWRLIPGARRCFELLTFSDFVSLANDMGATVDTSLATDLRVAVGRLQRRLRQEGAKGQLTASQLSALFTVERLAPVRLVDLAAAEAVAPPTLTRTSPPSRRPGSWPARPTPTTGGPSASPSPLPAAPACGASAPSATAWLQQRLDALSAARPRPAGRLVPC